MQFGDEESTGDWYLFDYYTQIRVYGADVPPYRLPLFPTMWVFTLEYIHQTMKADQFHFVPTRKGYVLKLPTTISPFTVNSRHTLSIGEMLLQGMDLVLGKF